MQRTRDPEPGGRTPMQRRRRCLAAAMLTIAVLLPSCAAPPASPYPPAGPVPDRAPLVDIEHYDVDVEIDHLAGFVKGQVAVRFAALPDRPATTLELDAVEMQIGGLRDAQGRELQHEQRDHRLIIPLAEPLRPGEVSEVTLDYTCFPRRGMYFVGPTAADPARPWHIWTQGETHEARYWIPCWDLPNDRATHALHVTVDARFRTVAAGRLAHTRIDERAGLRTDTWEIDVPHVSYLFTLVAGELGQQELPGFDVPLLVVADARVLPDALSSFASTPDFLRFFGDYTGQPYPYAKYAQCCVHDFTAGGQENISATTLLTETIHAPEDEPQASSESLIAHEAAHQWFGDFITCRDWSHLWLNESFATWFEALNDRRARGVDHERLAVLAMQRLAVDAEREQSHPIVWTDAPTPGAMFGVHSYEGGATRLHLLDELLGTDVMQRAVAHYVRQHAAGVVETEDLRRALEESSGADLRRFFDEWLYGAGFPKFRARLADGAGELSPGATDAVLDGPLSLAITQTQGADGWRPVFHLPVTVAWSRGGTEHAARLDIDAVRETLDLAGSGPLDWVRFDATTAVPGAIDAEQSESMWRAQLRSAADAVTRLIAAQWFAGDPAVRTDRPAGWQPSRASVSALIESVEQDPFAEVRVTALAALAGVESGSEEPRIAQLLLDALTAPDAALREVAAAGLGNHGGQLALTPLVQTVDDANAAVVAAALGALVDRGFPGAFSLCEKAAARDDRAGLDQDIVQIVSRIEDDEQVLPFLMAAARSAPAPRVRAAALRALAGLPDPDGVLFRQLGEALNDGNHRVRAAAARGLRDLGDDATRAAARLLLQARRSIEVDPSVLDAIEASLAVDA